MKIKTPLEFIPFSDGYCVISRNGEEKHKRLAFSNGVMGFKRHFAARAAQTKIDRVIKIPMVDNIDQYDDVVIPFENRKYNIELIQMQYDTCPPSIALTLRFLEVLNHG